MASGARCCQWAPPSVVRKAPFAHPTERLVMLSEAGANPPPDGLALQPGHPAGAARPCCGGGTGIVGLICSSWPDATSATTTAIASRVATAGRSQVGRGDG